MQSERRKSLYEVIQITRNAQKSCKLNEAFESTLLTRIFSNLDEYYSNRNIPRGKDYTSQLSSEIRASIHNAFLYVDYKDRISETLKIENLEKSAKADFVKTTKLAMDEWLKYDYKTSTRDTADKDQYTSYYGEPYKRDPKIESKLLKNRVIQAFTSFYNFKNAAFNVNMIKDSDLAIDDNIEKCQRKTSTPVLVIDNQDRLIAIILGSKVPVKIDYNDNILSRYQLPKMPSTYYMMRYGYDKRVEKDFDNVKNFFFPDGRDLTVDEKSALDHAIDDDTASIKDAALREYASTAAKALEDYIGTVCYRCSNRITSSDVVKIFDEYGLPYKFFAIEYDLKLKDCYDINNPSNTSNYRYVYLPKKFEKKFTDKEKYESRAEWRAAFANEVSMAKINRARYNEIKRQNSVAGSTSLKLVEADCTKVMSLMTTILSQMSNLYDHFNKSLEDTFEQDVLNAIGSKEDKASASLNFNDDYIRKTVYNKGEPLYQRNLDNVISMMRCANEAMSQLCKAYRIASELDNANDSNESTEFISMNYIHAIKYFVYELTNLIETVQSLSEMNTSLNIDAEQYYIDLVDLKNNFNNTTIFKLYSKLEKLE